VTSPRKRVASAADLAKEVVFSPIQGSGLVEQTVRRLGEAIEFGLLDSGGRLPPEHDLAARLQVSLVTLREALAVLREAGYLTTRRGRGGGTFVQAPLARRSPTQPPERIDTAEIQDLTDYREIVATGAATLACARASEEDLALLTDFLAQMDNVASYLDWRRLDGRFHITIAAAAKSPRLVMAETTIQRELGALLDSYPRHPRILRVINEQHAMIVQAISRKDAETAVRESQVHVRNTAETLLGMSVARPIEQE
jgi:GntR family transcriptional regulator, transcriptional repressor for pyruvate dehydrogenase complex